MFILCRIHPWGYYSRLNIILNIKKTKEYDAYIGRRGYGYWDTDVYFGNPFEIGKNGTREDVIQKFRDYFNDRIVKDIEFKRRVLELNGKRLGCFCKPLACHGDVKVLKYH